MSTTFTLDTSTSRATPVAAPMKRLTVPAIKRRKAEIARGEAVALPPFDAVPFPLDSLFPFDDPAAPPSPSLET